MNRKELKDRAKKVIKGHYWILVVIFLMSSLIGLENASSVSTMLTVISARGITGDIAADSISTSILDRRFTGYGDIVRYIAKGFSDDRVEKSTDNLKSDLQDSISQSGKVIKDNLHDTIYDPISEVPDNVSATLEDGKNALLDGINGFKDDVRNLTDSVAESAGNVRDTNDEADRIGPVEIGTTAGVFAGIFNAFTSGKYFNSLFTGIATIFRSESAAAIVMVVLLALFSLFLWFFVARVFIVIFRRMTLEARTYEQVPLSRLTFLTRAGKWMNTAWVMFVTTLTIFVWFFTIVGGVIAYYRYIMVPYILAENPSISARDAMKLSRDMMDGHKKECFVLQCTFIGWRLLGILTLGLSEVFFSNIYSAATYAEYYVYLRNMAKKEKIVNSELLNDTYLYEFADNDKIADAYEDIVAIADNPMEEPERLSGVSGFFARNFGIVLFAGKREKEHCVYEEEQIKIERKLSIFENRIYPMRLFPGYRKSKLSKLGKYAPKEYLHYTRRYSIWSIILLFFIFSFIGWGWEVFFHLYEDGVFVNRGVLHGPYLPIYGTGSIMILLLLYRLRKKPFLELGVMCVLCGTVEYMTAFVLYNIYGKEWWNYDGYFLNVDGWICAEALLLFVAGGMGVVYLIAPALDTMLSKLRLRVAIPICVVLLCVFLTDMIVCAVNPNAGAGITDYDQTEVYQSDYQNIVDALENSR